MYARLGIYNTFEMWDTEVCVYFDGSAEEILAHDWQAFVDKTFKDKWEVQSVEVARVVTVHPQH